METPGPGGYRWAAPDDEEWLGSSQERPRPRVDPYAAASLGLGARGTLPLFSEEPGARRLVMKRKVLRRRPDGGVEVSDESVGGEAESDAEVWSLGQKTLHLRSSVENSISEGEIETGSGFPDESLGNSPSFLLEDFGSRSSPPARYAAAAGQPKSFIPPRFEPLGRNRGKTDRVAKYFEYKREWEKFPIPGEDPRQELRWAIREQMLCRPELPDKPQRLYVPNSYAVPTQKKRSALCWGVRWDLAKGLLPRKSPP